ncbi:hypothetical protein [Corynebacterium sp.]|uniref:hypothetical protein n=1 Tax=Corynebacterium sp. TaxID=1720 RepID=UPI0028A8E589|nr:hypothetical protein [Corynebacterium sp.]
MTTRHTQMLTPLGELTVVAHADAVTGLYFPGHTPLPPTPFSASASKWSKTG